jgi:lipid A 4'-phosphatase
VIKKFKIELIVFSLLILNIFISSGIEVGLYNVFYEINLSLNNIHLKEFFIKITKIGDSLWVFLFSASVYFCCFFLKNKFFKINIKSIKKIQFFSFFLFITSFLTGTLTQIIKHIIGRPRPNHVLGDEFFGMSFFNFESSFHSFPSGHTSTIFAVALTFSIFTPKLKYFYFIFAGLIGWSRVVVEAHYFSDVVGGIVLAFVGVKLTHLLFIKLKIENELNSFGKISSDAFVLSLIVFFMGILLFSIGSSIDIYFSSLFYKGNQTFFLQNFDVASILIRKIFLRILIIYLLVLPFFSKYSFIKFIFFNFRFSLREVVFVFTTIVFNLVFVVNVILKNLWGRARPNDILEFGGKNTFTPWYKFSNECELNCSFVSGDASVGFAIIILYFVTKNKLFLWLALLIGGILGGTRIIEGGHFLSDVWLSGFLIFTLSYLQWLLYKKKFK